MKRLKLFPKIFLYTLGLMLFIVVTAHILIFFLAPKIQYEYSTANSTVEIIEFSVKEEIIVAQAIKKALPISLICCVLISIICSLLFSKAITDPIGKISTTTGQMKKLEPLANCPIHTKDEIGILAQNINDLYSNLLSTIEHLEREKDAVRDMEREKVDFLRAASHELKTPVTALNATLENMILGVGKYQDYDTYLPECKEMVQRLSTMIHEILETSRLSTSMEQATVVNISDLLKEICEPYRLIAAAHQIDFSLELHGNFSLLLPVHSFSKVVSNVISNAVSYTAQGKKVSVYLEGRNIVIENECMPINEKEIPHLFEPFFRPDFSRNKDSGGNGLGLYIVKTLLTTMNIDYSFIPMATPDGMRFTIRL